MCFITISYYENIPSDKKKTGTQTEPTANSQNSLFENLIPFPYEVFAGKIVARQTTRKSIQMVMMLLDIRWDIAHLHLPGISASKSITWILQQNTFESGDRVSVVRECKVYCTKYMNMRSTHGWEVSYSRYD